MAAFVTDNGLEDIVTDLLGGTRYLAWGNATGQLATDLQLANELSEARPVASFGRTTTNTTNDTLRITGGITATGVHSITEVGVFSTAAFDDATLDIYADFAPVAVNNSDTVHFTIDMIVDQA